MPNEVKIPQFSYPFKRNTKNSANKEKSTQEFYEEILFQDYHGQYLFNRSGLFHGGVHLYKDRFPFNDFDTKGIRAIADGKLIHYRVDKKFLENELDNGTKLKYSSSFMLLEHEIAYPATNKLKFYSLYMHMAPMDEYTFMEYTLVGEPIYVKDINGNDMLIEKGSKVTLGKSLKGRTVGSGLKDINNRYELLSYDNRKPPINQLWNVHITNIEKVIETTVKGTATNVPNIRKGSKRNSPIVEALTVGESIKINAFQTEQEKAGGCYAVVGVNGVAVTSTTPRATIHKSNLTDSIEEPIIGNPKENGLVSKHMTSVAERRVHTASQGMKVRAGDVLGKLGCYNSKEWEDEMELVTHVEVFTFDDLKTFIAKATTEYARPLEELSDEEKKLRPKENLFVVPKDEKELFRLDNTKKEFIPIPEDTEVLTKTIRKSSSKLKVKKDKDNNEYVCIDKNLRLYVKKKKEYFAHGITFSNFTLIDEAGADKIGIFEDASKFYSKKEDEIPQQEQEKLNDTFKTILQQIKVDKNKDGKLEAGEFAGLSLNKEKRKELSYMMVKHESEWEVAREENFEPILKYMEAHQLTDRKKMFEDRLEKLAFSPKLLVGDGKTPIFIHPIALVEGFVGGGKSPCFLTVDRFIEMVYFLREKENMKTYKESFFDKTRTEMLSMVTSSKNEKLTDIKSKVKLFVNEMNSMFKKYEINSCKRKIHFISQMYLETMKFRASQEAIGVCSGYFGGCDFRGRGMKQLTHDYNYLAYYDYIHNTSYNDAYFEAKGERYTSVKSMIGQHPKLTQDFYDNTLKPFREKISTELFYAFDSAGWFSTVNAPKSIEAMDKGLTDSDVKKVTKIINGGVNNLSDRQNYCKWLKEFFKDDL